MNWIMNNNDRLQKLGHIIIALRMIFEYNVEWSALTRVCRNYGKLNTIQH